MKMIENLQDPILRGYHKSLKYTNNYFLSDILTNEYFDVEDLGTHYSIIPLFYTDEIVTDWDNAIIDSPYKIIVPKDFKGLITFRGNDNQKIVERDYTICQENDYYVLVVFNKITGEILTQQEVVIRYSNEEEEQLRTMYNGYLTFRPKYEEFEVLL